MSGLSKLGTGLTVVFVLALVALLAELLYVLWCRRRFRQQNHPAEGDPDFPGDPFYSPSKELLYFFCWNNQSRIEPAGAPAVPSGADAPQEEVTDVLKWQVGLYGPSRVLFTIKEEEREEMESETRRVCLAIKEEREEMELETRRMCLAIKEEEREEMGSETRRVCLEECVGVAGEVSEVTLRVDVDGGTPFSTPCASPPYYTPLPSPTREVESGVGNLTYSTGNDDPVGLGVEESLRSGVSGDNKVSFVSLDVHGGV